MNRPYQKHVKSLLVKDLVKFAIPNDIQTGIIKLADYDLNQLLILKNLYLSLRDRSKLSLFAKNKEKNLNFLHIIGKFLYNKSRNIIFVSIKYQN